MRSTFIIIISILRTSFETDLYLYSPPRPFASHANWLTDGGTLSTPQDHFTSAMRMSVMLNHHLFRQLPYHVRWDSRAFYRGVQIEVAGRWISAEDWAHHPSSDINNIADPDPLHEFRFDEDNINYPSSSQYPSRSSVMTTFVETFVKYGRAIPDIASRGVLRDLPVSLIPVVTNRDVLRPSDVTRHGKYHIYTYYIRKKNERLSKVLTAKSSPIVRDSEILLLTVSRYLLSLALRS